MFNWKEEKKAQNAIYLDKEMGGKGRQFKSRFLVPGLVKYDYGVCLLTKENADKFIQDFVGCPVIINHQDVTDENAKEISVGNIFSVWFDEKDGYYWCNGIITDKDAIKLIEKGYSVSCQYTITEYSDNNSGALHNGNPYDKIIENGRPEHLAIVNNPRYEGAIIAVNAILAQNEDKWITVHPHGEDEKGRHLLLKDGETPKEAMQRQWGVYDKRKAKEGKKEEKKETYYEDDMEENYTQDYADSISKDFDEFMKSKKEEKKEEPEKSGLDTKREAYESTLKRMQDAHARMRNPKDNADWYAAAVEENKAKKELTKTRREYAESIMDNFVEAEENPYEEKQAARKERYQELSEKAAKESSQAHQQFRDKMSFIPAGQPIHGARDARYRERAWDTLGRAVKLNDKSNYYADKADSVGKAGISSDDANAIAKLARKYKSGVDSAEKRRIIDRVIDIHKRMNSDKPKIESYSDLGFNVERNTDINRLQLKFNDIPDANTRSILKSYGFRWSPREAAWQRQLTGNAEYSLKQIAEKLKASNSFIEEFKDTLYTVLAEGIANRLGELIATNKNQKEKWVTIKGNHILLKEGESIADAFKRTTGVSLQKSNKYQVKKETHQPSKKYTEILESVKKGNSENITPQMVIESAIKNIKGLDAQEVRARIAEADKYNENIRKYKLDTQSRFSKDHKYTEERKKEHQRILTDIFKNADKARPKPGEKPSVLFLGGRGGSGKSKFNGLVYNKDNYIVLDADEIKNEIKEYQGYNAFEVHEESSDILNMALNMAKKEGLNVVLDATMKSLGSTEKKIKSFDDAGYNIEMYYMHLPREKAAERAIGRFMGERGRYVPLNVLINDMKNNEENFDKLKKYASKWAFYNNDVASKDEPPILVDKNY